MAPGCVPLDLRCAIKPEAGGVFGSTRFTEVTCGRNREKRLSDGCHALVRVGMSLRPLVLDCPTPNRDNRTMGEPHRKRCKRLNVPGDPHYLTRYR